MSHRIRFEDTRALYKWLPTGIKSRLIDMERVGCEMLCTFLRPDGNHQDIIIPWVLGPSAAGIARICLEIP